MIRPLRRRHYGIWIALTIVLSALFTAGLMARRPTTPNNPSVNWEKNK